MVKRTLVVLIALFSLFSTAQITEYYYFDSNWKPVSKDADYAFYRIINFDESGTVIIPIKDYFRNGYIQAEFYSDKINREGIKYGGTASTMGMYNGKIYIIDDGFLYTFFYNSGKVIDQKKQVYNFSSQRNSSSLSNSVSPPSSTASNSITQKQVETGTVAVVGALLWEGAKWFLKPSGNSSETYDDSSTSYSSDENSFTERENKKCFDKAKLDYPKYTIKQIQSDKTLIGTKYIRIDFSSSGQDYSGKLYYNEYEKEYYIDTGGIFGGNLYDKNFEKLIYPLFVFKKCGAVPR